MELELSQSREEYDAFCKTSQLPLCCYPWYLDAVCEGGQWQACTVMLEGEPIAAWPYFEKQRFGLRYVTMPPFTKYMGIMINEQVPVDHYPAIFEALLIGVSFLDGLDQQFSSGAESFVSVLPSHYKRSAHHTHQIQLISDQDWRKGINRNMRRNIRKAEQHLSLDLDCDLSTFHRISALSFQRQGLSLPYSYEALQKHDAALLKRQRRQIFAARDATGQIHSVAYLMWSDQVAYYHLSGDDPALRRSGSGIWLIAQALDYASQLGIKTFDFEGSMIPAIAAIREQFGAEKIPYSRVQMGKAPLYRLLKWWRQRR